MRLWELQEPGTLTRESCIFRRGADGSEDACDGGRFLPATAARTDQPEASAGAPDRPDQLGATGNIDARELRVGQRSTGELAAPDCGAAVFAARVRSVRRRGRLAMGGEPVLAGVHGRDLFADGAADRPVEPDALEEAPGRSRC